MITIPAYFKDVERQATRNAGEIASLNAFEVFEGSDSRAANVMIKRPTLGLTGVAKACTVSEPIHQ